MLKADFHIHTNNDPKDKFISYSNKEVIDKAFELGFEVIAITLHGKHTYDKKLADYAKKKDILLISGIEANINKKEVVILNAKKGVFKVKTFSQLRKYKKKNPNIDKLIRGWIPHKKETEQNNNGGEIKKQIWTDQRTIL